MGAAALQAASRCCGLISMDLPFAQDRWGQDADLGHQILWPHRSEEFGRGYGVLIKGWRGRCSFLAPQVVSWSGFEPTAVSLNGWLAVGASQVPGWSPGWMQAEGNRSSAGSSTCHRRRPSVLRYGPWVGPWAQVSGRARTMRDQHGRWEALAAPEGHGGVLFRCALMDGAGP